MGCRWLDGLPDLVTGLERDWGIAVGDLLPGGSAGLVVRAINAAGEAVLRKLGSPAHDNFANQVAVEGAPSRRIWETETLPGSGCA